MATFTFPFFSLLLCLLVTAFATSTSTITKTKTTTTTTTTATNFLSSKCSTTSYPTSCVRTLTYYSAQIKKSPRQLAQAALTISLSKARYAKTYMSLITQLKGVGPKEAGVTKDCLEEIRDAVERLSKSVHEFQTGCRAGSGDFLWHMSNVQTWASAAITDVNTCVDEVKGLKWRVKSGILAQFKSVLECTSNALALVNQFANNY